jgi:hypothetical protein
MIDIQKFTSVGLISAYHSESNRNSLDNCYKNFQVNVYQKEYNGGDLWTSTPFGLD